MRGVDPLHDPDDEELPAPEQARELAARVEAVKLADGAVRDGRVGKVGVADVVLNGSNPLTVCNHACGLWGSSAQVAHTLLRLESVFAEAGRPEAVVHASPTTVADIEGIADDSGWRAAEECVALLYRPESGESRVPTHGARGAVEGDLAGVAALLADHLDLSERAEKRLVSNLAQRLDDPRCLLVVTDDSEVERIASFALGFVEAGVGLVDHVAVRAGKRGRGHARDVLGELVTRAAEQGAEIVVGQTEEGSVAQRFAEACGFTAVYPVTVYTRGVGELFG